MDIERATESTTCAGLGKKVLKKMFRGKHINGVWKRRTNMELQELYGEPTYNTNNKGNPKKKIISSTIGGKKS